MRLQDKFKKEGDFLFRYRSYLPLMLIPLFILVVYSFGSPMYEIKMIEEFIKETNVSDVSIGHYNNILIIIAICVGLAGQGIRILVAGFVPKDTSGRNTKEQKASRLNTKGIYSTCRNPLYLGNFLMMLSPIILVGNWIFILCFCLCFWLYYERIIYAEEAFLSEKFKDDYISWVSNTPCFIPSFKKYIKSDLSFSFKSMLKREYHSLFGLASSLLIVHYIIILIIFSFSDSISKLPPPNYIILGFFVICFIIYLISLFLSKKTNILNVENR